MSDVPTAAERRRPRPIRLAAGAALVLVVAAGCRAQRELRITSDPPGAAVRVDDELIGETPLSMPFIHYGVRRVTFYMEGHETRSVLAEIEPPWYGRFPIDIFSEILVPIGWRDVHALHVALAPGADTASGPTLRSVFERAEALRRAGAQGPRDLQPAPVYETSTTAAPDSPAPPAPQPAAGTGGP